METTSRMVYIYSSNITVLYMPLLKEQRKFTWAQFAGFANASHQQNVVVTASAFIGKNSVKRT